MFKTHGIFIEFPGGSGPPAETFHFLLEDDSGDILLEDDFYFLLEDAP